MSLERVEKKKILGRHNREILFKICEVHTFAKWLFNYFFKKAALKHFAIFTEKYLCWNLFLLQNITKSLKAPILNNICEWLLLKMCL